MSVLFYQSIKKIIYAAIFCAVLWCAAIVAVAGQEVEIKIKISPSLQQARIEEKFFDAKVGGAAISFPHAYADVSELAARVENFAAFDEKFARIKTEKLAAGEYQAATIPKFQSYDMKIAAPANPASKAHVSWLADEQGILMLNDLLPLGKIKLAAKIFFDVPPDWKIVSAETPAGDNVFSTGDAARAVFFVGKNSREKTMQVDKTNLNLTVSGAWQFSDDESAAMAASILQEYRKLFGEIPVSRAQIFLLSFSSQAADADRWRAETRGRTVTIISGAMSSKREALQRLHEQLRHEIFHLWIPNAVNLTGSYDWFYEGFTIYEALRTGVELNQIRFEDYLNTLSRAFDLAKNQNVSLVAMSNRRWTGGNNSVYAKGMIVALLCDLAMIERSKGKHQVAEIFQKLYRKYHDSEIAADGNRAVIEILKNYPELSSVIARYIEGTEKLDIRDSLKPFGIEFSGAGAATELKVAADLNGRQKDLLNKLGYNQWRKLLR